MNVCLVLTRIWSVFFCGYNAKKTHALAKSTENTEWNVSAWIFRPEKLIVPQWTRSVNRVCGRISLNHARCLGGLHKQSSQWSRVYLITTGKSSMCICLCACVCVLRAAVIPAGRSRVLSWCLSFPGFVSWIRKIDNDVPDGVDSKFNSNSFVWPNIDFLSWLHPVPHTDSLSKLVLCITFCTLVQVERHHELKWSFVCSQSWS